MEEKKYKSKYKRKNMISLCLSDDEMMKVDILSSALNVPRATAVREILVLNAEVFLSKMRKNENKDLVLELNKIGNNLNQITKKINANIDIFLSGENEAIALTLDEINDRFKKILEDL